MRIAAPNYTQTPNVMFDEVFRTLTEGELRIVLILIRQTFGWHKDFDRITLNQLAEKSGYLRTSVCRILNSLIQKGLVEKKKFGTPGKERCYFGLVVEIPPKETLPDDDGEISEEEMALISNNSYQSPYGDPPSLPTETPPVSLRTPPSKAHTYKKETRTKETKKNISPTPLADRDHSQGEAIASRERDSSFSSFSADSDGTQDSIDSNASNSSSKAPNSHDNTQGNTNTAPPRRKTKGTVLKREIDATTGKEWAMTESHIYYGDYVVLSLEQARSLKAKHGNDTIMQIIRDMDDYCAASRPKGYHCYASAIRQWLSKRNRDNAMKVNPNLSPSQNLQNIALKNRLDMQEKWKKYNE